MQATANLMPWLVERPRVTALLAGRWDHRLTAVVADAGYGKTTAVVLARRSTATQSSEFFVPLDASCASAPELVARVRETLGLPESVDDSLVTMLSRRAHGGPFCVAFDDVHELPAGSPGERALADLIEGQPANLHLVFCSRQRLPFALARLRAARAVLDIDQTDLAYDAGEVAAIAEQTGVAPAEVETAAGWPALVSLIVSRGHGGAWEYLAEEVFARFEERTRAALAAAVIAGGADAELLRDVAGYADGVDTLAASVPLVLADGSRLIPHDLWGRVVREHVDRPTTERLMRNVVTHWCDRDEQVSALRVALRLGDDALIADVVHAMCAAGRNRFDATELDQWLAEAPSTFASTPEGRLLAAIAAAHRAPLEKRTRQALQDSVRQFRRLGLVDCEVVAMSELAIVLRWQGRSLRLKLIIGRLFQLARRGHATAAALAALARGVIADHRGDSAGALAAMSELRRGSVQDSWLAVVEFLRCHQLLNLGRIREACDAAGRSRQLGAAGFLGGWCSERSAAWHLGVTRDRLDALPMADEVENASSVDQVWIGAWFGAMQAYAGRLDAAGRNIAAAERALHARHDPQLVGFVAWARAAIAVAEHDPDRAAECLSDYLRKHPIDTPFGARLAARAPALVELLLADSLPADWEQPIDGPWQQTMRQTALALQRARVGEPVGDLPDPALILCALPLPWAVELAVRTHQQGAAEAEALARHIVDVAGDAARDEIAHLAPQLRSAAEDLFTAAGDGSRQMTLQLLGPILLTGPTAVDGGEQLRRRRVREILAFVALTGPVSRERIAATLWPDLEPSRASANLRVNLAYAGRIQDARGRRVLTEDATGLALSDHVECDALRFEATVDEADQARRASAGTVALELYEKALAAVAAEPLADTRRTAWFEYESQRLTAAVIRAADQAAILALELGETRAAIGWAGRAVALDPYRESAWRTLARAHLVEGDRASAQAAAARLHEALAELDVEPTGESLRTLRELGVVG